MSDVTVTLHLQLSSYKRRKQKDKLAYEEWKSSVTAANKQSKAKGFESNLLCFIYCINPHYLGHCNWLLIFCLPLQFLVGKLSKLNSTFRRKFLRPRSWRLCKRQCIPSVNSFCCCKLTWEEKEWWGSTMVDIITLQNDNFDGLIYFHFC